MDRARSAALAAVLLAGACSPGVSGEVRDATSGAPVARAAVELGDVGWGMRNGQLVWDAAKTSRTATDDGGKFAFAADGGTALTINAPGLPPVETSLCPRSPTLVRIGGPYPRLRANERLMFGPGAGAGGTSAAELGLTMAGDAMSGGSRLRLAAAGGVSFVAGKGAIPPPPPLPYPRAVELDVAADCGWLFVSDGRTPVAVIEVAPPVMEQDPDGTRRHVMLFAPLPEAAR